MPCNASRAELPRRRMTNSWRTGLNALPRLSARGCFVLGVGLIFLVLHDNPKACLTLGALKSLPWDDRVLLAGAWFAVSSVLLSLVMVALGKLVFLTKGQCGGMRPIEPLIAMAPGNRSGWELGLARYVPMISARLAWLGHDFIRADLDPKGCERLVATRRGYVHNPQRRVVFEDFFGLARVACETVAAGSEEVLVYPQCRRPEETVYAPKLLSASDQSNAGGKSEGDRTESREYIAGEPTRHMLWQVAARTGGQRLYVRVPETAGEMFFRVIFVPGGEDEQAAQFADYLLRENPCPWGSHWLFSIAGGQDTWEPGTFPEARKALACSANATGEVLADAWAPCSSDACVYLAAADPQLPEKFASNLDPAKTLFLIASERGAGSVVAELAALGFDSRQVTMVD